MQATERIGQDIIRGESGLEYRRWPSALTVNIHEAETGQEVDVFTLGGASGDDVSHDEFREAVERHEAAIAEELENE